MDTNIDSISFYLPQMVCENEKSHQGLGSIPASKKWGSGSDPRVHNVCMRLIPQNSGTYPRTAFLWTLGLIPEPLIPSSGM